MRQGDAKILPAERLDWLFENRGEDLWRTTFFDASKSN